MCEFQGKAGDINSAGDLQEGFLEEVALEACLSSTSSKSSLMNHITHASSLDPHLTLGSTWRRGVDMIISDLKKRNGKLNQLR